ncbi:MAG: hypothetical protein FJ297_04760 [Planctomycetes bacterium]|nr:hypothetical protein [Planctomycetota bacterium]
MSRRIVLSAALFALAGLGIASSASAACDACRIGPYLASSHASRLPLRVGNVPTPPYFAVHPPVYYSGVVRRPYGDSPDAYASKRPQVRRSAPRTTAPPAPRLIVNPYYSAPAAGPST